jgi:hypothetical protein
MHRSVFIILVLAAAGCTSRPPVAEKLPPLRPLAAAAPVKFAETRYEVRSYRDPAHPSFRHEAHAIYRRTRVPVTASNELETVPRKNYPPMSIETLPASEELAAELATQKTLTLELRSLHAALVEAEKAMKAQYDTLVRQSSDAVKLREQLEAERQRLRSAATNESPAAVPLVGSTLNPEVKW